MLKEMANGWDGQSFAGRMRQNRLGMFKQFIKDIPRPVRIVDVGGCEVYYKSMGFTDANEIDVTLVNLQPQAVSLPNFKTITGDGRNLTSIADKSYDVAFSNSTIEHVGAYREQMAFAREITRVGNRYFIQTPNRYFPMEPHFLMPFFQFLPTSMRARLHSKMSLGWWRQAKNYHEALAEVESIRLLSRGDFRYLFPQARIQEERCFGLTKSFMVMGPCS